MAKRLKVYQARMGFYDSVVAAANQGEALRAWGARQNLFAVGEADEAQDAAAIKAALAHPQTPLRRAIGSDAPFALEGGAPLLPDLKGRRAKPAPDRSKLDSARAALEKLTADQRAERSDIARRRQALEDREQALSAAEDQARDKVDQALKAFRKTGGKA